MPSEVLVRRTGSGKVARNLCPAAMHPCQRSFEPDDGSGDSGADSVRPSGAATVILVPLPITPSVI